MGFNSRAEEWLVDIPAPRVLCEFDNAIRELAYMEHGDMARFGEHNAHKHAFFSFRMKEHDMERYTTDAVTMIGELDETDGVDGVVIHLRWLGVWQ